MEFLEESFSSAKLITLIAPAFIGLGLISFVYFLNGKIGFKSLALLVLISVAYPAHQLSRSAITELGSNLFESYLESYLLYILFLTALWDIVFWLHRHIERNLCRG